MKHILCKLWVVLLLTTTLFSLASCGKADKSKVKIIDIPLTQEEYAFCVAKENVELLQTVNRFLAESKDNGVFDEILNHYFGEGESVTYPKGTEDSTKEQLVVATNTPFAPFEYQDGGEYTGIDIELMAALAEDMGCELVIKEMEFDAIFVAVESGYADIGAAGITYDSSRDTVTFTDTYYNASQMLVVAKDNPLFDACHTKEDVEAILATFTKANKGGVQEGTTGALYLQGDEDFAFDGFSLTTKSYENGAMAVQDLINGNLDVVVLDEGPAKAIVDAVNDTSFLHMWQKFTHVFIEKEAYKLVLLGLSNTLLIAIVGLVAGIVIGTLIALVHIMPKYKRLPRALEKIVSFYVAFFRGTPIVVQLLLGYYVLLPLLNIRLSSLATCMIIFGLNSGAYVSEIMRAGIASVHVGQLEAARALGLGFWVSMLRVVVPQAIKNILPTIGNELISLVKETSVVSFVAADDLFKAFRNIGGQNYEYIIPYLFMAVIYIILVLGISGLIKLMERRLKQSDRH